MAQVGYARVSSVGQSLDMQMEKLACSVRLGPAHKLSAEQITELWQRRQDGVLIKTLMQEYDLSKTSVYRYLASAKDAESQAS